MPIYEVKDDLLPFRKDGTESFSMLPVGTIFASVIPQTDARVHLLDGSTILQTGIYKTFANLIKSLVAAGHNITYPSDTEFYSDVSTYGQCGKFVIDDVNGTIRLPLITEFIASNNGGKEIGLAELDMFKQHSHQAQWVWDQSGNYYVRINAVGTSSTTIQDIRDVGISWEGGSETRPKNVRYPYYIVLAAGYKSDQVVDIDNIVTELNSKLTANWTLIYTNNNISAGFAGQTLSLNLSKYKEVMIYCVATNAVVTPNLCLVAPTGNTNALHMRIAYWDSGQSKVRQIARQVTSISNSGITFGDGFFDGSESASLNACIPKYILAR